ncbi:MAG: hypothetical protein PHP29_09920, partial [Tissierellia bacterium]|nr:hypothetical protein [Tissierellia bacterium]
MKTFKTILTAVIILMMIFTLNTYGLSYEASNHYELENIILEQMKKYNPDFTIKYTGSLNNIEEVLKSMVNEDIYLSSNITKVDWTISGTTAVSNINVKTSYIMTKEERIEADKMIDEILADIIKPYMNDHEKV